MLSCFRHSGPPFNPSWPWPPLVRRFVGSNSGPMSARAWKKPPAPEAPAAARRQAQPVQPVQGGRLWKLPTIAPSSSSADRSWKRPKLEAEVVDAVQDNKGGDKSWKQPKLPVNVGCLAPAAPSATGGRPERGWKQPTAPAGKPASRGSSSKRLWKQGPQIAGNLMKKARPWKQRKVSIRLERQHANRVCVNIDPATLKFLCADSGAHDTKHTEAARQPNRIQDTLKKAICHQQCSRDCPSKFGVQELVVVCTLWSRLTPCQQSTYIVGLRGGEATQSGFDEARKQERTDWQLCGRTVCRRALIALLGVGWDTFTRRQRHAPDLRKSTEGGSTRAERRFASNLVDMFFIELYHSISEDLPETFHLKDVDALIEGGSDANTPETFDTFSWTPEASLADGAATLLLPDARAPVRHLPPGKPAYLFKQFEVWWEALGMWHRNELSLSGKQRTVPLSAKCPCWTTFYLAWDQKWSKFLKFRKVSQHKECSICFDYRTMLSSPKYGAQKKKEIARDLLEHLRSQYHDRLIYWSLRWASRAFQNVLCIIVDGMDKVKTAWPKWPGHRKPAYLEGLIRPRCVLSAVMAHGWFTGIYLAPEDLYHGAAYFCEFDGLRLSAGPHCPPVP